MAMIAYKCPEIEVHVYDPGANLGTEDFFSHGSPSTSNGAVSLRRHYVMN